MILGFLAYIFIFGLGLCIGSFLNCVIYRLPDESPANAGHSDGPVKMREALLSGRQSLIKKLRGRSFCPNCKHTLSWTDLVPVFSFMFFKAKCRYCRKKISWQYPAVELATGAIFLLILNFKFQILNEIQILNFINLAFWFYVASSLIIIFVYDLKHYIIPDKVLFPAIGITAVYRIFEFGILDFENLNLFRISDFGFRIFGGYLLAAIIASGFFLVIFLISKGRWMGFGDVKLVVLMGLLLGVNNVLAALFLAFFFGAIISIILIVLREKKLKSEIPFGPFLIIGTFMAMFWGQQIISWYFNMFI